MTRVRLITIPLFREITEEKMCDNVCSFQEEKKSYRVENTGCFKTTPCCVFRNVFRSSEAFLEAGVGISELLCELTL